LYVVVIDRALYRQFVDEVIIKPGSRHFDSSRTDVTLDDHVCLITAAIKIELYADPKSCIVGDIWFLV